MRVDGLGGAEGLWSVDALQRLPLNRRPDAVARRDRRHEIVGAAAPLHSFATIGLEGFEPIHPTGPKLPA